MLFNNKQANYLDWFFIIAIVFMTGIAVICAKLVVDKVNDTGVFSDVPEAQNAIDKSSSTLMSFDNLMIFVIIGLSVFVLVSSAVVFNHPSYFIAGTFLLFIAVTVAASISNAFWKFTSSANISATAALYPKLLFLMENFPLYIAFMGMASAIVMYVAYMRE